MKEIKTVGLIGLGALGALYAHLFTRALGRDRVFVLADTARTQRYRQDGFFFNGEACDFNYVDAAAASEPVDLLLFAVKFGGLEINFTSRDVYIDGVKANLTPKEYDLLFYLVRNKNIALTRNKLLEEVWGYDFFGDDRTIDTHIKMLRNNLGPYRNYIVTLRGMGYKFEAE